MVVDDAVVVRGLIARWVEAEPDLQIVASLRSGREAIEQVERTNPDVVILDVDMPDIDGITALPRLLEKKRDLVVLMASTLTRRNAEIEPARALARCRRLHSEAAEPAASSRRSPAFRRELIDKIRALGSRRKRAPTPGLCSRSGRSGAARIAPTRRPRVAAPASGERKHRAGASRRASSDRSWQIVLRPFPATPPRVLLIGSSTGGPQALNAVIANIGAVIDHAPVLITQHMPPTFTDHPGRASDARERPAGARGGRRRAGSCRPHLCRARRPPHAGRAPRRRAP